MTPTAEHSCISWLGEQDLGLEAKVEPPTSPE